MLHNVVFVCIFLLLYFICLFYLINRIKSCFCFAIIYFLFCLYMGWNVIHRLMFSGSFHLFLIFAFKQTSLAYCKKQHMWKKRRKRSLVKVEDKNRKNKTCLEKKEINKNKINKKNKHLHTLNAFFGLSISIDLHICLKYIIVDLNRI